MLPMGFLYPGALVFFALVPLLIVAYLVRERPRSVMVSSVLGYRALRALKSERPWGWPRLDWLFLIELVILSLVVLAMAEPYVIHQHTPVAVVLDNSAAMQAGIPPGARFEAAKAALQRAIPNQNGIAVSLYVTAPQPHLVRSSITAAQAQSAISRLQPIDAPQSTISVAKMLGDLVSGHRFTQILFASSDPVSQPLPPSLRVFRAGDPLPNFADWLLRSRRSAVRFRSAEGTGYRRQLQLRAAEPGSGDFRRRQGPRQDAGPCGRARDQQRGVSYLGADLGISGRT